MPMYTYRREDGTTFDVRQKFSDDPLDTCPTTGQGVVRIVQNAGVIFKGSGFYINDSKNASKSSVNGSTKKAKDDTTSDSSGITSTETKSTETKSSEPKSSEKASSPTKASSAAD